MDSIVVGLDFGKESAQISYFHNGMKEPETVSAFMGREDYAIPMELCRQREKNRWAYGEEARRAVLKGEGVLITNLLQNAIEGNTLEVDGDTYTAMQLLVIFIRKMWNGCLQNLGNRQVSACMVSVEEATGAFIDLMEEASEFLPIERERLFIQNHGESFYYYALFQNQMEKRPALPALLLEEWEGNLSYIRLSYGNGVARVERKKETITPYGQFISTNEAEKDHMFYNLIREELEAHPAALIYLIGAFFEGDWMKESLQYICKGRRVFLGSNLYSKGCAFGAYARVSGWQEPYLYLGEDRLQRDIGLRMNDGVLKLAKIGQPWYEADCKIELVLEETYALEFEIKDVDGKVSSQPILALEGLPVRRSFVTAVELELFFEEPGSCQLEVRDIGFGEITPSSERQWSMTFSW